MYKANYSILRYVPNVLREEFVNIGVVLICPELEFQKVSTIQEFGNESRIKILENTDGFFIRHAVNKLKKAIEEKDTSTLLGKPDKRFLTANDLQVLFEIYRVNNLQFSLPRSVATLDPVATLNELFLMFIGELPLQKPSKNITRTLIRQYVHTIFSEKGLLGVDQVTVNWEIPVPTMPKVDFSYQNQVRHCYQAISFSNERNVTDSVNAYRQSANDAREYSEDPSVKNAKFTILGHLPPIQTAHIRNLLDVLETDEITVLDYVNDVEAIAQNISRDLNEHHSIH